MAASEVSPELEALLARVGGADLVRWHRANAPDIDVDTYLLSYRSVLVRGIQATKIIYLDTNFWIRLRDAENAEFTGALAAADARALLTRLRALTKTRSVICVGHAASFLELVKQSPQSLRVSARIFDQLSDGIVIAPPDEQRYCEARDFVFDNLGLPEPNALGYWSKIGQVVTSQLPATLQNIPDGSRQAVGKALLDVLWNAGLEEVLAQFNWDPRMKLNSDIDSETIARVESRKAQQLADRKSRQAIRVETFSEHIVTNYATLFHRQLHRCNAFEGYGWNARTINDKCDALIEETIACFRADRMGFRLPMAVLLSELYSLYEFDAGYELTCNDWVDWQHAAAALPHSDVFFTEAHLAHQLKNVLHADEKFNCTIASNLDEAIDILDEL